MEMQARETRLPGKIAQLEESQQQLIELINGMVSSWNVDDFETKLQNIAKDVFPDKTWPANLEPLPTARIQLSTILRTQSRFLDALKQGTKGCLLSEQRIGYTWVRNLFDFVQVFSQIAAPPDCLTANQDSGCLTEDQLWDLLHGYLYVLLNSATATFGSETAYTRAIHAWYSASLQSAGGPSPGSRAFSKRFEKAQKTLLMWAGVEEQFEIALK
jgi:hypothetical protein